VNLDQTPEKHPPKASSIHAIIPVFNEAKTIQNVLSVLSQVECLGEIIVVNDGSTDDSASKIEEQRRSDDRIRTLTNPRNMGKGQSVLSARQASPAGCYLMLDADLYGLKPEHIKELITPVQEEIADMTIGQFKGGYWRTDLSHWATPWLSGQRCLRSELFEVISPAAAAGYGIETALTLAAKQNGWRCVRILLRGVWHRPSEVRRGAISGYRMRLKMYAQIGRAWYLAGGLRRLGLGPTVR
jgi:glycosyltransferase involved in cell wall biosynthesis